MYEVAASKPCLCGYDRYSGSIPPRLLRLPEVVRRMGRSKTEIYRLAREGKGPRGRRQSHKVTVWYETEVDDWVRRQILLDLETGR